MMIDDIRKHLLNEARRFGAKFEEEKSISFILRNNTGEDALNDNGAYFGLIQPEEENSGPYHDLSLVIFPSIDKSWVLSLGVGSQGFKNDYELASTPGIRRLFSSVISGKGYCKTNFNDIETNLPKSFLEQVPHLKKTLTTYTKVLPVCEIIDWPIEGQSLKRISAFVACYAQMRGWGNQAQKKEGKAAIEPFLDKEKINEEAEFERLLLNRKYVILEGPPGTGKTRLAKLICKKINAELFFTQFHPEVSYSDFVSGIRPDLENRELKYKKHEGLLMTAIKTAQKNKDKKVVLVIDEINRANLSNILGPLFYLLEYNRTVDDTQFLLPDGTQIETLPSNLFIVGTMNTSDRSLAVVDFALRRRFAWYALKPHPIAEKTFHPKEFSAFNDIFYWHADSNELNFQPGQAYFIADDDQKMADRIRYELFPLIKEYLAEGILIKAKEDFNNYFLEKIGKPLFE